MAEFNGCITRKANSNRIVIEAESKNKIIKIIFTPKDFTFALTASPRKCEVIEIPLEINKKPEQHRTPNSFKNHFPILLKQFRNDRGYTQKTIADLLDVTVRTIVNYENGLREPDIQKLVKLANFFNVSLDKLIAGKDSDQEVG